MIKLDVTSNIEALTGKVFDGLEKQVRFAAAMAINDVATEIVDAERDNMMAVFDGPTPFTLNSVGVRKANRTNLTAIVYVKDIAAAYLEPYEKGGLNKLNSRALLKPIGQRVNQYGNLPRNTVARLAARSNVFVGKVKGRSGVTDGVWQRTKARRGKAAGLKLLIKFDNAHPTRQRLNWAGVARGVVDRSYDRAFRKQMKRALATAR